MWDISISVFIVNFLNQQLLNCSELSNKNGGRIVLLLHYELQCIQISSSIRNMMLVPQNELHIKINIILGKRTL